ncbi:HDOD domain-containing protein [Curvibacter sp. APW13]|uniref:HDOD domain-containing protein n=1 Tax=Curvibacter sp. APW13 TaxID=3077236 RepID=UPI0028E0095F|nr:HDOD domain-containing protein [Curvibacter sp. APW13]MDT8991760.1 HDOD domain-containing protein [Curvibacter sp. APW13]
MASPSEFLRALKLPAMPEAAQALMRTLKDDDADIVTVRDIIAKDPALTATLLRMANSAMFGLSRSVSTLDNAVQVVGMSHIRARALSICMTQTFKLPSNLNRLVFWRHSMVSAGYAAWLAHKLHQDEAQAWMAGMMHRLGELVIALSSPQLVDQIENPPSLPGERWLRERTVLGFDEGQLMAEVARRWDFPDEVVAAFSHLGQPIAARPFSTLAAIIHLASMLADMPPETPDPVSELPAVLVDTLALDVADLQATRPDPESFVDMNLV